METLPYVIYKTTNLLNGKIYVGRSVNNLHTYVGSGIWLWNAIRKYGRENFQKEVIEQCPRELWHDRRLIEDWLDEREKFWIESLDARNRNVGYNISPGGYGFHGPQSVEHRAKISKSLSGKKKTSETREKLSIVHTNKCKGKYSVIAAEKESGETFNFNGFSHACRILGVTHYDISTNFHEHYSFNLVNSEGQIFFPYRVFSLLKNSQEKEFETSSELAHYLTDKIPENAVKYLSEIPLGRNGRGSGTRSRTFRGWKTILKIKQQIINGK